jgi:hypothetical protein
MAWWKIVLIVITAMDLAYLAYLIRFETKARARKRWQTHDPSSHVEVIEDQ